MGPSSSFTILHAPAVRCPEAVKSISHATFRALAASHTTKALTTTSLAERMQMRGLTLIIATILTFGYGFAAQAAMTVDRASTYARVARTVEATTPVADANRVWYGGMLAPVTIEAKAQAACPPKS